MRLAASTYDPIRHSPRLVLQFLQIIQWIHQLCFKYDRRTLPGPPIIQALLASPPALRRYVTSSAVHTDASAPVGIKPVVTEFTWCKHLGEFITDVVHASKESIEIFGGKDGAIGITVNEVVRTFSFGAMNTREVVESSRQDAWNITLATKPNSKG